MRLILRTILFVALVCAPLAAAEPSLLPDRFGPWQADGPVKTKGGGGLFQGWGDGHTDALREAGLAVVEDRNYLNGSEKLPVRLHTFKDTSGAYEFYTQSIAPGMKPGGIGDESGFESNRGVVLVGNLVAVVGPSSATLDPQSLAALVSLLKSKADATPYPPLRSYLPERWRVFGTEKYSLGPVGFENAIDRLGFGRFKELSKEIGFQDDAEAILARYQGEKGGGVLLLILYPTPQVAENRLHHLEQALDSAAKAAGVTVERKASMLSLVFGAAPLHAQAIRDEVNYETQVTWNEPSTTATDPPLVLVLFKIFVFTTMFLIVATVAGMFFGGARILIKHWLPGKIFDRPQDIEVIQLGLTGKKIDPTDMY